MTATDLYKRKNVFNLAPAPSSTNVLATEVKPKFQSMDEEVVADSAMMATTENESAIDDEADDRRQLEIPSQLHRSFGHKNQRKRRINRSNNPKLAKRQRPSEFNNRNDSAKNSINSNKAASVFSNSYSTPFYRGRGRPFGSTKQEILRRKLQKRIAKEMLQNNAATINGNNSNLPRNNENDEAVSPGPRFYLNNFDFEQLELLGAEWGLRIQKRGQHLLFFKPVKQSTESKSTRILRHTTMGLLLMDNGDHVQVDECEFVVTDGSYRPNAKPTDRWYKGSASAKKFLQCLYKKMAECFKDGASK